MVNDSGLFVEIKSPSKVTNIHLLGLITLGMAVKVTVFPS